MRCDAMRWMLGGKGEGVNGLGELFFFFFFFFLFFFEKKKGEGAIRFRSNMRCAIIAGAYFNSI